MTLFSLHAFSAEAEGNSPAPREKSDSSALKQEALQIAQSTAKNYSDDPLGYALLGSAFFNTGRSEEAIEYLRKCIQLNPKIPDAYAVLARAVYEKGDAEEAIRICEQALKECPATIEILTRLGRSYLDTGRSADAIQTLQQVSAKFGATPESSYLQGQAHMQTGQFPQARKCFETTIQLIPDHTQAFFGLYTACQRMGDAEQAEKYRQRFTQLEAADRKDLTERSQQAESLSGLQVVRETAARTIYGAGQIYFRHEKPVEAVALFQRAAELDEENEASRMALETIFVQHKNATAAIKIFESLIISQPNSALNYFFLGRLHARLGHNEQAEQAFTKQQQVAPKQADGHRALAEHYLRTNRKLEQARAEAAKAVELEPTAPNYFLLALISAKTGNRAAAIEAAKKAASTAPGEAKYAQYLEQLQKTSSP